MKLQVLVDKKLKETLKIQSPTFVGFFACEMMGRFGC